MLNICIIKNKTYAFVFTLSFLASGVGATTPLIKAICSKSEIEVEILLRTDIDPNEKDELGRLPLCEAVKYSTATDDNMVYRLLDHRVNVHLTDNRNRTPLHYAAMKGNLSVTRLLLEAGADPNVSTSPKITGVTPLCMAISNGNIALVRLLIEKGAKVDGDERTTHPNPLQIAVLNDHTNIVRLLLEHGARPGPFHFTIRSEEIGQILNEAWDKWLAGWGTCQERSRTLALLQQNEHPHLPICSDLLPYVAKHISHQLPI